MYATPSDATARVHYHAYRDRARKAASDMHKAIEAVIADARADGRFPPDHTNEFGDRDNSACVRAERAAYEAFCLLTRVTEFLTPDPTRAEVADVQDYS